VIRARPVRPPGRLLAAAVGAASACALVLVAAGPPPGPLFRSGRLAPDTVLGQLRALLPADARAARVDNLYGSATGGVWQFVAFLSWRDAGGRLHEGQTELPLLLQGRLLPGTLDAGQLAVQQRIGWPLAALQGVLDQLPPVAAGEAMLEAAPAPGRPDRVTFCRAAGRGRLACEVLDRTGRLVRRFSDGLRSCVFGGPLAVQRASDPVTGCR
jgi:hypothetical protein